MRPFALRIIRLACIFLGLSQLAGGPCYAAHADCAAGTLVTVVAHLDDDLLFVEPDISAHFNAGWCVTTVHLIGGAYGSDLAYVQKREQGLRLAYARLAGVPNEWQVSTIDLAGQPVVEMRLNAQPRVRLLELRLPGGAVRGGREPLGLLWDEGATLTGYPLSDVNSAAGRPQYNRDSLSATLRAILADATSIDTLNPDTVPYLEHPDHIYSARITRHVAQTLGKNVPIAYFVTYPIADWPPNVPAADTQRKRDIVATYFAVDGGDTTHVFGEYQWDGNWVARRYASVDSTAHRVPDFVAPQFVLFNAASSRCLASTGNNQPPTVSPCDDSPTQKWEWQPRPSYPGNEHDAALVNAATRQCIAERDGDFTAETCQPWDAAQRWTPWDFGIVYTPSRHCLGVLKGRLNARGCAALTTQYRWSIRYPSLATDLRLDGPLYGDVAGHGESSGVYVQRRGDGPGFDVYVKSLGDASPPVLWYANAVPFDYRATHPTCGADTLCFDRSRFLLADFEGRGRVDLMVIASRHQGTAFWLLRNSGNGFAAPVLWFQTDSTLADERAQQYVAASLDASGRAGVIVAQQGADDGLNLWTIGAEPTGRIGVKHVMQESTLRGDARMVLVRKPGSAVASLFAVEAVDRQRALAMTPIIAGNGQWTTGQKVLLPATLHPDTTRFAADDLRGDSAGTLTLLTPHLSGGDDGMDVWTLDVSNPARPPVRVERLPGEQWADVMPALIHDAGRTRLVLYRRVNALLGDFYFTGGESSLVSYPLESDGTLGAPGSLGTLPVRFSETLWIARHTGK